MVAGHDTGEQASLLGRDPCLLYGGDGGRGVPSLPTPDGLVGVREVVPLLDSLI